MMIEAERSLTSRALRFASLALLAFVALAVVSGVSLTVRGEGEMEKSDTAFHEGDLRGAIFHARKAALAFVPGAEHVGLAHARLEAIGRGAEAKGDEELARVAWDALRVVAEQTDYPGRPDSTAHKKATESLKRLRKARRHDEAR
jgi:hypothetical protein